MIYFLWFCNKSSINYLNFRCWCCDTKQKHFGAYQEWHPTMFGNSSRVLTKSNTDPQLPPLLISIWISVSFEYMFGLYCLHLENRSLWSTGQTKLQRLIRYKVRDAKHNHIRLVHFTTLQIADSRSIVYVWQILHKIMTIFPFWRK